MLFKKDEKCEFVKEAIGTIQSYTNIIKNNKFTEIEKDILFQSASNIRRDKPDTELIYQAYKILNSKSYENSDTPYEVKNKDIKVKNIAKSSPENNLMLCPDCNKSISKKSTSCPNCGVPLIIKTNSELRVCPHCESKIYKNRNRYCPNCELDLKLYDKSFMISNIKRILLFVAVIILVIVSLSIYNKISKEENIQTKNTQVKKPINYYPSAEKQKKINKRRVLESNAKLAENDFRIIKDDVNNILSKRTVEIMLSEEIDEKELTRLANKINKIEGTLYKKTFILYYIKGQDKTQGAWASTDFNPNLKVNIYGLSKQNAKKLKSKETSSSEREIIGVWLSERPYDSYKMILYRNKNQLFLDKVYPTFTTTTEMKTTIINSGAEIYDIKGKYFGEYFLLKSNGSMEFWSKTGKYYSAKKIQYEINGSNLSIFENNKFIKPKIDLSQKTKDLQLELEYYSQNNKTYFIGQTNLPENTKIGISIDSKSSDYKIYINKDGTFKSAGFSYLGKSIKGEHEIELIVYKNKLWQNNEVLKKLDKYKGYGIEKESGSFKTKMYFEDKKFDLVKK